MTEAAEFQRGGGGMPSLTVVRNVGWQNREAKRGEVGKTPVHAGTFVREVFGRTVVMLRISSRILFGRCRAGEWPSLKWGGM